MESKDYLKDISEIKNIMNRSSRFISLSGLSGVLAGIYALIAACIAHKKLNTLAYMDYTSLSGKDPIRLETEIIYELIFIAICVVILAITSGIILSVKKAKKKKEKLWDVSSKRLVVNFLIPLFVGGLFCIVLLQYGIFFLVAPTTLIFYGLACVNASKYTLGDVRYLGISNIIIGLIATQFIGYGLYFWALGFGVFHIFYGTLMHFKHDRK
ncbi:MAG: hypothetical protein V3U92_02735 [Cellulophaga sp.]